MNIRIHFSFQRNVVKTSDKPMRAGPESDIFFVPNLNVMYKEVTEASWDKSKCAQKFEDIVIIDIKGPIPH